MTLVCFRRKRRFVERQSRMTFGVMRNISVMTANTQQCGTEQGTHPSPSCLLPFQFPLERHQPDRGTEKTLLPWMKTVCVTHTTLSTWPAARKCLDSGHNTLVHDTQRHAVSVVANALAHHESRLYDKHGDLCHRLLCKMRLRDDGA